MEIKVQKLTDTAILPSYATPGSAGLDLYADIDYSAITRGYTAMVPRGYTAMVPRGYTAMVPTGIAVEIPPGFEGQIRLRSSFGKMGFVIPNAPGTIDSDYRGEIIVLVQTLSEEAEQRGIRQGERFAQLVIAPIAHVTLQEVEELDPTRRGTDGFGSTGN